MAEDFDNFSSKISSLIQKQDLNADITEIFFQNTNQIIAHGILNNPNSDNTNKFINETVPNVGSMLLSSKAFNSTQLQFSNTLMKCLNTLALWGMLNEKEVLVNNLLSITDSNASYYEKNSFQQPNLFIEKVHYFFTAPLWEQLNDKMATPEDFQVSMLFSIYAFIFQYCSSCNSSDEIVRKIVLKYSEIFCGFVDGMSDETLSKCRPSNVVVIMESLNKIYSAFNLLDALPVFMKFVSRSAKSDNFEKQLSALRILNSYALSKDEQIVKCFDEWKKETDVVSSIISMDLPLEILQNSKDLIKKVIHDDELLAFLIKGKKSCFIVKRHFSFHIIAQIIIERFEKDAIIDLMTKLQREKVDIEFLCILLIELFKSQKEELLTGCENIVDLIFEIGGDDFAEFSPRLLVFFKELNEIDSQNRNNPKITFWRVKILTRYIKMLREDDIVDRISIFLADQFEELRQISLLQPLIDLNEDIQEILNETLTKVKQRYISINCVSEAMIRLFYIIILFKNIEFIEGEPNHILIKEASYYESFDFALDALMHCNDPYVTDIAIELFSQLFSRTAFYSESITILYNCCINQLCEKIDPMAKYRILKLIYKVLIDLEDDFELIDFESIKRNHRSDIKGKNLFKFEYKNEYFDIYAKPNSTAWLLINRIAMRLHGTTDMIKVTDSDQKDINPTCLAYTLNQPLNVICLQNYSPMNYSSASYALWNLGFTSTLLEILDNSSQPELKNITKRLLSFLPCDQIIMRKSVDDYFQMINDAQSDEKFKYLLHYINHFDTQFIIDIGNKINQIWEKIKSNTNCNSAIFEFFIPIIDKIPKDYKIFLAGRVFRTLYIHDKKAYKVATDLFTNSITSHININDENFLKKIIINCNDEQWPYLRDIIKSFQDRSIVLSLCSEELSIFQAKTNKFFIKIIAMFAEFVYNSGFQFNDLVEAIIQFDNSETDVLIDTMRFFTEFNIIKLHDYFLTHQENMDKIFILVFKIGTSYAEKIIFRFLSTFRHLFYRIEFNKILIQLFDQKHDVWNYKPAEYRQNKLGIGLKNLGSTCYMNSLFQVFNRIPTFLNEIFASSDANLQSFQWVLASLQKSNRDFIDPSRFINEWKGWKGQTINPKVEQNVTEFYYYIIQSCPENARNLFTGEQTIKYIGDNGFEKEVSEPFFSLSVKIKGFSNLVQSIYSMIEPEIVNNFDNEKGDKIIVTKSMKITKCPKILVVQINRFESDQQNNQKFEFPEHLNISPLLQEEKNSFYSLHSIICHSEDQNKGYYALLHENKEYNKVANIFKTNDEKWISIKDQTITELPNGNKNEEFGKAYLLFYVLDDFLIENGGVSVQLKNSNDELYKTILKENGDFGTMQTLFSVEVAKFVKETRNEYITIHYLYNILMHGSSEFKDYINDIIGSIGLGEAINYTIENFSDFLAIFENPVPKSLIDSFVIFSCEMMKREDSIQIFYKILDVLSLNKTNARAITPLLMLVYSYLKENKHFYPFDIIRQLVNFIINCINQKLSPSIKIDNAFLSLTEILKREDSKCIEHLQNFNFLKSIEDNIQLIPDHISNIESLNDLVEQAAKYNLMKK